MTALVTVHLHGPLGAKYGTPHALAIRTPREAVAALDANFPGFLGDFARHERYGIVADDDPREGEDAAILPVSRELHFVPFIEGNIPAIVPIVAAAFGIGTVAATIISGLVVTGLLIGISLLFRPKMPESEAKEQERDESFIFTGPENVTEQGVAIPLIYGRVHAGSVVVSAGQDVVDDMVVITTAATGAAKPATLAGVNLGTPSHEGETPVNPPEAKYVGGHSRSARLGPSLRTEELTIVEDAPLPVGDRIIQEGGGIYANRDDPPVEGWPEIVEDPVWGYRPEGWILAGLTWVVEELDESRKQVMVWQPDYDTVDFTYNWNMVRGFYVTDGVAPASIVPEEEEWMAGAEMEIPVEDPVA